jgi:NIMA (never in mitosis gene a)-related kinase
MNLLSTIRVPKNLLYLTDRLPKPNYNNDNEDERRRFEEKLRRRTYEGTNSSPMLPDISQSHNNLKLNEAPEKPPQKQTSLKRAQEIPPVLVQN